MSGPPRNAKARQGLARASRKLGPEIKSAFSSGSDSNRKLVSEQLGIRLYRLDGPCGGETYEVSGACDKRLFKLRYQAEAYQARMVRKRKPKHPNQVIEVAAEEARELRKWRPRR